MEFIKEEEVDEVISSQSFNFAEELDVLMDQDIDLGAPYSFCKVYPSAPNPGLHLSSLGYIGVPLNEREAQVLKSVAVGSPGGIHGFSSRPDPKTGKSNGIWAIGADQVTLKGPQWKLFVDEIIEDVCANLDIRCPASQLSWEMTNLIICETGADSQPDKSAQQREGKIATIAITLPSNFEGGATHLSYGALRTTYDHAVSCPFEMTAMAWYQDVIHLMSPVTGGYRLVLAFDLFHSRSLPRPVCGTSGDFTRTALRILTRLIEEEGDFFEKVLYLFPQLYTKLKNVQDLSRLDSHKVQLLEVACCRIGLCIGFTTVRYWLRSENKGDLDGDGYGDSDSEEVGSNAPSLSSCGDETLRAEEILSLDGRPLMEALTINERAEITPKSLVYLEKMKQEEKHVKTRREFEVWYEVVEHVGLLLWSSIIEMETKYEEDISDACRDALNITSLVPSPAERALKRFLVSRASENAEKIVDVLCHLGILWHDLSVYVEALEICRDCLEDFKLPSSHGITTAIDRFGFDKVQESLDAYLTESTPGALRLLRFLQDQLATRSDEIYSQTIHPWLRHRTLSIAAAGFGAKKGAPADAKLLVSLIAFYGETALIKDQVLPWLRLSQDHQFLRGVASEIEKEGRFQPTEMRHVRRSGCTTKTLRRGDHVKLRLAKEYIAPCLEKKQHHLLQSILDAIMDCSHTNSVTKTVEAVFLPLLSWSSTFTKDNNVWNSLPQWIKFAHRCTTPILGMLSGDISRDTFGHQLSHLLNIVHLEGGSDYLINCIIPHIDTKILRKKRYHIYTSQVVASLGGREATDRLHHLGSRFMAKHIEDVPIGEQKGLLECFKNCLSFRDPFALSVLIQRLFRLGDAPTDWVAMHTSLFSELMRLVDDPQKSEAMAPYFRAFFLWWMQKTIGLVGTAGRSPIPAQVAKWRCSCHPCEAARSFIMEYPVKTWSTTIPQADQHVKNHLDSHLQELTGFSTELERDNNGSQSLTVKFSADPVGARTCCAKHRQDALGILAPLRTRKEYLQSILGDQYQWVISVLSGVEKGKQQKPDCGWGGGQEPEQPPRKRQKK